MNRFGFRSRLFVILLSFALVPSAALGIGWFATSRWAFSMVGATAAWDSVAASGSRAADAVRTAPLTRAQRQALDVHQQDLQNNLLHSKQLAYVAQRAVAVAAMVIILLAIVVGLGASRVAGHLSRQLSRPLMELIGWTGHIGRGEPLPPPTHTRGAPEFEVLRARMRVMADEIELGRARAVEAERAAALREAARQAAHELKNPLTPIRFAVARLRREAPHELEEIVDVLATETTRLETLARSFSQFGRLPEGPRAPVDLGELTRYVAQTAVPPDMPCTIDVDEQTPMILGHHDALHRALSNVVLNAVEASRDTPDASITLRVAPATCRGQPAVAIDVQDTGPGIPPEQLARMWDPYVTYKAGGTGLGLAIARQTTLAHDGEVSATSTVGTGTTIRFLLPVGAAENTEHVPLETGG